MKIRELFEEEIQPLKLVTDNPGGEWLKDERDFAASKGKNKWGAPARFGTLTAKWNRPVLLPVDLVARIKGINAEQSRVRDHSLHWLTRYMGRTGRLPRAFRDRPRKQYAPFVQVYQDGTPWMNEGNHRIMAAKKLGWKYIPMEISYFNGAELEEGMFAPHKVKELDMLALRSGYHPTDDFNAREE